MAPAIVQPPPKSAGIIVAVGARDDTVNYRVFTEECYRMCRATFDEEPVKDELPLTERDNPAFWRDCGPRFTVRIDLC